MQGYDHSRHELVMGGHTFEVWTQPMIEFRILTPPFGIGTILQGLNPADLIVI